MGIAEIIAQEVSIASGQNWPHLVIKKPNNLQNIDSHLVKQKQ